MKNISAEADCFSIFRNDEVAFRGSVGGFRRWAGGSPRLVGMRNTPQAAHQKTSVRRHVPAWCRRRCLRERQCCFWQKQRCRPMVTCTIPASTANLFAANPAIPAARPAVPSSTSGISAIRRRIHRHARPRLKDCRGDGNGRERLPKKQIFFPKSLDTTDETADIPIVTIAVTPR